MELQVSVIPRYAKRPSIDHPSAPSKYLLVSGISMTLTSTGRASKEKMDDYGGIEKYNR